MKKLSIMILALLLLLPAATLFARGGSEEVIDDVELAGEGLTVEGVFDMDFNGWEQGRKGGRIILSTITDPAEFNGVVAQSTDTTDITDLTESWGVRRSGLTLEYEPELASGWTISDDEQTITFTIKRGLQWSDGASLDARDFVFTFNHLYLRADVGSSTRGAVSIAPEAGAPPEPPEVKLIDNYTFSVTLPTVYVDIVGMGAYAPYPRHIFGPVIGWDESDGYEYNWSWGEDEDGNAFVVDENDPSIDYTAVRSFWGVDMDVTDLVASGPMVLAEYLPSERVVLRANPNYWETDEQGVQLPYLDEVVYVVVPDQDTSLQRFRAGEIDVFGMRGEDYAVLVGEQEDRGFKIFNRGPTGGSEFITMNQNPIDGPDDVGIEPPTLTWLSNKTFRQAVAYMVDRDTIINNVAAGLGFPQYAFVPRQSPYYWDEAENFAFKYDPARARELLDSIDYVDRDGDGWREDPDGNKIDLTLATNVESTNRVKIFGIIAEDLRSIGLDVEFTPLAFSELVPQLVGSYDWEMIGIGLTGGIAPPFGTNVYPSYGDLHMIEPLQSSPRRDWEKEIDELYAYANNTADPAQTLDGYEQIQRIWIEEAPWVFTYNALSLVAVNDYIGNYKNHPFNAYGFKNNVERVFIR